MKSRSITTKIVATTFAIDIFRTQVRKPANYFSESSVLRRRIHSKMNGKPRRCLSPAVSPSALIVFLAYARKRAFRPPAPEGLIDLLMTNLPLEEDELNGVLEVKYGGSDKLRGLWLIFDSAGAYKGERLLLQSGSVSAKGSVVIASFQGTDKTRVENNRVKGQIQANIQSSGRITGFDVSFDVPVGPRFVDTGSVNTSVPPQQFLKDYQTVMPGNWTIERWMDDRGGTHIGTLSVHERIDEKSFRGTLHFAGSNTFDEEVVITRVGAKVHFDGRVPPETNWYPDILTFDLKGNLLVGGGTDSGGNLMNVVLRKIK